MASKYFEDLVANFPLRPLSSACDEIKKEIKKDPKAAQRVADAIGRLLQSYTHTNAAEEDIIFCLAPRLNNSGLWKIIRPEELVSKLDPKPLKGISDAFLHKGDWE